MHTSPVLLWCIGNNSIDSMRKEIMHIAERHFWITCPILTFPTQWGMGLWQSGYFSLYSMQSPSSNPPRVWSGGMCRSVRWIFELWDNEHTCRGSLQKSKHSHSGVFTVHRSELKRRSKTMWAQWALSFVYVEKYGIQFTSIVRPLPNPSHSPSLRTSGQNKWTFKPSSSSIIQCAEVLSGTQSGNSSWKTRQSPL